MLRKLLWIAVSSVATLAARQLAARAWRLATGEEPPTKKQ